MSENSNSNTSSVIEQSGKQVMKVYAARDYDARNPRLTNYVEINLPEFTPTIPKDDQYEQISISSGYCLNQNFPINGETVRLSHSILLPLLRGTSCPVYFPKNTPFILFTPTTRLEDGYLLYI